MEPHWDKSMSTTGRGGKVWWTLWSGPKGVARHPLGSCYRKCGMWRASIGGWYGPGPVCEAGTSTKAMRDLNAIVAAWPPGYHP